MSGSVIHGRQKRPSPWRQSRYFFLVLAIACLGLYSYTYVARAVFQTYQSWLFDRLPDHDGSTMAGSVQQTAAVGRVDYAPRRTKHSLASLSSVSIIGRLSVPRLHLSAMVREGVDTKTLRLSVGHIPTTALPGQAGNVGIAGHRDTFFRKLKDLRAKDEIVLSTLNGNFRYEVESLTVVEPDDLAVLAPSTENTLTMVTCYPFSYIGSAPKRFIVRARQVSPLTQAAAYSPGSK
jgi:sortase A